MIDTLKTQKRLIAAGFEPDKAEAITESLAEHEGGLVTKDHFDAAMRQIDTQFKILAALIIAVFIRSFFK